MDNKKNYVIGLIAFFCFFIIILGYFVTHKPISPSQTLLILSHIWKIFLVFWLVSIAGGLGKSIFKFNKSSFNHQFLLELALGLGIFSFLIMFLGSIWKINLNIFLVLFLLLTLILFGSIKSWIKTLFQVGKSIKFDSNFSKILFVFIIIIFISQLFITLAPATHYDALNYHLTLPKAYLIQERISDLPWLVMSGMPQISEMIYLPLMSLGGESSILFFNWVIGLFIALGLLVFMGSHLNFTAGWVTVTSLYCGYTFSSALSWGYVDLMAAFFGLSVFISLVEYLQSNKNLHVITIGIFSGLAFGCKYPAGVIFLAVLFTLIFIALRKKIIQPLKSIGLFCFGAALFALPWLVKNFVFTGNPVYPFFFASGSMTQIRLDVYQGLPPYGTLLDLFLLPIRATFFGVDGTNGYSVSTGPLLLGLGLLSFVDWENKSDDQKNIISLAGLVALFGLVIWAIGNQFSGYLIQTRFYFVLFPIFSILAGYGYSQISKFSISNVRIKSLVQPLIVLVIALNSFQIFSEMVEKGSLRNILGFTSNQQYLEDNLGWYARAISDANTLENGSKVLMIYEPRGFGCIPNCDPDEILDHWKVIYHQIDTNEKIISAWLNDGFTHLLVYTKGIEFLRENYDPHHPENELDALEELLTSIHLTENYGDWYKLYELDP